MTMQFRALAAQAQADGEISAEEVLALRHEGWADGRFDPAEADALFVLNDHLAHGSSEWADFFVETIVEFVLSNAAPRGYVSQTQADWLIGRIAADGRLDSLAELELLERLFEQAVSVPASLTTFALGEIERAVLTGEGPTRDGAALAPGCISAGECRLLRRFVFAPAGERPAAVSQNEAELLFRLKDATLGADNAPEWRQLFVQGVGSYLQGFGGAEPLSAERASELEQFMNRSAGGIANFLSRMARADPEQGARNIFRDEAEMLDFDDEVAAAAQVTGDEDLWLQSHIDADGELDELEQALLDFLAEV